jgi:tetratricopeptide (TPR) repeat protein
MAQRATLRGAASYTQDEIELPLPNYYTRPYYPNSATIQRADRYAAQFKLKAAERLYNEILDQNPRSAAGWNGLGKVAFYKTTSSNQNLRDEQERLRAEARQAFLTALRYQPGYVEAQVNLARVLMEEGRMSEAGEWLQKALWFGPRDYRTLAGQGEWLVRKERYDEAVPYLRRSIQLNSAGDTAHYFLGTAYAALNREDEALEQLQTTIWLNPNHAPAHYQMARIYQKQGNGAAAVEHYQTALHLKPELYPAREQLAKYLEDKGDVSQALFHWKRLQESYPGDWEMTQRIARLSIKNQQPDVAIAQYRDWIKNHPGDTQRAETGISVAKTELARLKLRDSDLISQGEAKRYVDQALNYQPNNFEARMLSAKLDREMGGAKSPIAGKDPGMVDVALRQPSQQPYQSFEQGRMWLARYQFGQAETAFREARRVGEGNRNDMVFGELFLNMGLPELAQECFRKVLISQPGNASAQMGTYKAREAQMKSRELMAEALDISNRENWTVSIDKLERALSQNIKNAEAHYRLGQLYEKTRQYAKAADHYYAYINLAPQGDWVDTAKSRIGKLTEKMARNAYGNPS